MRLNPPATVLGIVAVALGGLSTTRHSELTRDRHESCDAALALLIHIDQTKSSPLVLREGSWSSIDAQTLADGSVKNPALRTRPDFPIYQRAAELHGMSPVLECQNVRNWLQDERVPVVSNSRWEQYWQSPSSAGQPAAVQAVAISMPPISANGLQTIFDISDSAISRNVEVRMARPNRRSLAWEIQQIYPSQPPENHPE